jgi:hypothetical protein
VHLSAPECQRRLSFRSRHPFDALFRADFSAAHIRAEDCEDKRRLLKQPSKLAPGPQLDELQQKLGQLETTAH